MDLLHRVLHPELDDPNCLPPCFPDCRPVCVLKAPSIDDSFLNPPPPPSSPHTLSPVLIIVIAVLSSAFLLVSYYAIIVKYCANWRRRRVPTTQNNPPADEELDEAATPMNYIWYVSTLGLEESVINSIAVCKYKKGDGLIDGTECSVCLNEFREDEDLRLLPKCSHAFHVPCIDTWLKSHVNCPLCRASVVSKQEGSSGTSPNSTSAGSSAGGGVEISNSTAGSSETGEENHEAEFQLHREDGRLGDEVPEISPFPRLDFGIRVYSDLGQNLRSGGFPMEEMDKVMQPVRRSFSMDSSAAALFRLSLGNLPPAEPGPGDKKVNLGESSEAKRNGPIHKGGQSRALIKVMSHGYKGSSLFKGPVAMKRSFSSSGKFFLSRNSRSRNSVLPL